MLNAKKKTIVNILWIWKDGINGEVSRKKLTAQYNVKEQRKTIARKIFWTPFMISHPSKHDEYEVIKFALSYFVGVQL